MPEPLIFLILLVLVPLVFIGWFAGRKHATRLEALLALLFTSSLVVFLFQWGQYPYVGSYYLRYVLLILMVGAGFRVFRTVHSLPWYVKPGWRQGFLFGFFIIGSLVLIPLVWAAIQAHYVGKPSVEIQFPLRGGTYYISTGGSNSVLNLHYKPHTPAQMYAIDIDRVDGLGQYASGLAPDRLEDFLIFGETVYSPCDGRVIEVEDGMLDNRPFEYDSETGSGNYVVIQSDSLQVELLHFRQGSLLVQPGDRVLAGDPVGRVGNSGFSTQPHLHLQVSRSTGTDSSASQVGVPVRFGGRFLVRNSLFAN